MDGQNINNVTETEICEWLLNNGGEGEAAVIDGNGNIIGHEQFYGTALVAVDANFNACDDGQFLTDPANVK
jgi:hypothetical protein